MTVAQPDNVTHRANGLDPGGRSHMSGPTKTPESVIERFSAALQAGQLDDLVKLFEPDAVVLPATGAGPITGPARIREALGRIAALRLTMTNDIRHVVVAGDIAVVYNSWQLTGTGPDGSPVEMAGVSGDVVRRRDDGWGMLIHDPLGPPATNGKRDPAPTEAAARAGGH
jgi:uncharacterized protein (TIGR02246 family)